MPLPPGGAAALGEKLFALPRATPALYQPAPAPLAFELPPPLPLYVPIPGLAPHYPPSQPAAPFPRPPPPPRAHPNQAHVPGPGPGDTASRCAPLPHEPRPPPQRPPLLGANTCSKSLLARRSMAAPMSISLPPPPGSTISPAGSRSNSRAASPARTTQVGHAPRSAEDGRGQHSSRTERQAGHARGLTDATGSPAQATSHVTPMSGTGFIGTSHPASTVHRPQAAYDNLGRPAQVDTFPAYMSGAPSPGLLIPMGGFHSSLHLPLDPRQPVPAYLGASIHMAHLEQVSSPGHDHDAFSGSAQAPMPSPSHQLFGHQGFAPPLPPPGSAGALGDLTDWTGSFHLYSPGLTFSSSTPQWFTQAGTQTQYFPSGT